MSSESSRISFVAAVVITGLVAGTADGISAIISAYGFSEVGPVRVFQYVASGVFGRSAFEQSSKAVWGLLFHYFIATSWAFLYMTLYHRLKINRLSVPVSSVLYGCFVWLMMNKVILPLSNVPLGEPDLVRTLVAVGVLVVAIGFPITYLSRRFLGDHAS